MKALVGAFNHCPCSGPFRDCGNFADGSIAALPSTPSSDVISWSTPSSTRLKSVSRDSSLKAKKCRKFHTRIWHTRPPPPYRRIIFSKKGWKKTWYKVALNGLKCILNTTYFFFFSFLKKKVWKMTINKSWTPLFPCLRPQHNYSLFEASGHTKATPSEAPEEFPPGQEMLTTSWRADSVNWIRHT